MSTKDTGQLNMEEGALRDFISKEERGFKFRIGLVNASSLSGFVAGVVASSIVWFAAIYVFKLLL